MAFYFYPKRPRRVRIVRILPLPVFGPGHYTVRFSNGQSAMVGQEILLVRGWMADRVADWFGAELRGPWPWESWDGHVRRVIRRSIRRETSSLRRTTLQWTAWLRRWTGRG